MSKLRGTGRWLFALVCALALCSWPSWGTVAASQLPYTSTPTPSYTPTRASTDTPTPTHTSTPRSTDTPTSTDAPTQAPPTNTYTPAPPTLTHTPTFTAPAPSPGVTAQPTAQPTGEPPAQQNPNCQSSIEGVVLGQGNEPVSGATVTLRGESWSKGILTDDQGRYGFTELCTGGATVEAVLPGGQSTGQVTVSLSGENHVNVTLSIVPAPAAPTATSSTVGQPVNTSTPEPEMPTTGSASWLLVGGAALGAMLLLSAGVRRLLLVHEER